MTKEQEEILIAIKDSYQQGYQNAVDEACRWVENIHDGAYLIMDEDGYYDIHWTEFIKDFKKYMEEQQ